MPSHPGRSWRPEKAIDRRKSRKFLVFGLLSGLVGTIAFLVPGPRVPLLHFLVATEQGFRLDESALTPLPAGATALNGTHLTELGDAFHEANPQQIGEGETHASVAELVAGSSLPTGERLIIYCAADAWCVPDKDHPEDTVLELLPATLSGEREPVRFSEFLSSLEARKSVQTLLLLEFTGRYPGLASGAVADDIAGLVRKEVDRAAIQG